MLSTLEFHGATLTTARKEKLTNPPRRFSKCYEGPSNPRAYRGKAPRQAGSKICKQNGFRMRRGAKKGVGCKLSHVINSEWNGTQMGQRGHLG